MAKPKILVVRKMSALEYHYNGNHASRKIRASAEAHNKKIELISRILQREGADFDVITRRELSSRLVSKYDIIVSAGGDGTAIAAGAFNRYKPQLNLKTDSRSVGALCQSDIRSALSGLFGESYSIEEWTRLDVYLDGKFVGRASNQVCVGERLEVDKQAKYDLRWKDEEGLWHRVKHGNSGLVIATGTGSTGWKAEFQGYPRDSPRLTFSGISNVPETKYGSGIYFRVKYLGHEGKYRLDSAGYKHALPRDSILEVRISDSPLKVIIPHIEKSGEQ